MSLAVAQSPEGVIQRPRRLTGGQGHRIVDASGLGVDGDRVVPVCADLEADPLVGPALGAVYVGDVQLDMGQPPVEPPELGADAFLEPRVGRGVALDLVVGIDLNEQDLPPLQWTSVQCGGRPVRSLTPRDLRWMFLLCFARHNLMKMAAASLTDDALFGRVAATIHEISGIRHDRIVPHANLVDLGIYGDDGYDLVVALDDEFAMTSGEFDLGIHFGAESWGAPLPWQVTRSSEYFAPQPLTVAQLVETLKCGSWPDTPKVPRSKALRIELYIVS